MNRPVRKYSSVNNNNNKQSLERVCFQVKRNSFIVTADSTERGNVGAEPAKREQIATTVLYHAAD